MAIDIISRGLAKAAKDKTDKITVNNNINLDNVVSDINDIANQLDNMLCYKPTPLSLEFEAVATGDAVIKWLSSDGAILYGNQYNKLLQSKDEWETTQQVCSDLFPKGIAAIRETNDGELLITNYQGTGVNSKVYKTVGYDSDNPGSCTYETVLVSQSTDAHFSNSWGLSVYDNIVVASEYGGHGEQCGRRVYLSLDHGNTFDLIFDIFTTPVIGRPYTINESTAHLHTVAYDPYYQRIWLSNGDKPDIGTQYSDDFGQTWTFVTGSEAGQFTGIIALPDCVVFGSDYAPNGLHIYRRKGKDVPPVIEPFYVLNNEIVITQSFQLPYKRDWLSITPVYFSSKEYADNAVIMAFVDGKRAYKLFEAETEGSFAGHIPYALGETAQGNIMALFTEDESTYVVAKAPAPVWNLSSLDKQIVTEAQYNIWKIAETLDENVQYVILKDEVV